MAVKCIHIDETHESVTCRPSCKHRRLGLNVIRKSSVSISLKTKNFKLKGLCLYLIYILCTAQTKSESQDTSETPKMPRSCLFFQNLRKFLIQGS